MESEEAVRGDVELAALLRGGNQEAFNTLVTRHHASMVRVATSYVRRRDVAEEVAQEAWVGVIRGIHRFEGRAPLRAWIFGILVNCAKERATRDVRSGPSKDALLEDQEAEVPGSSFRADGEWRDHWVDDPRPWDDRTETLLHARELRLLVLDAISTLPAGPRAVISLRDVAGLDTEDVCRILDITEQNQRVLLHRARTTVRRRLARHFGEE